MPIFVSKKFLLSVNGFFIIEKALPTAMDVGRLAHNLTNSNGDINSFFPVIINRVSSSLSLLPKCFFGQ